MINKAARLVQSLVIQPLVSSAGIGRIGGFLPDAGISFVTVLMVIMLVGCTVGDKQPASESANISQVIRGGLHEQQSSGQLLGEQLSNEQLVFSERVVPFGFYASFNPVSYSADPNPDSEGFNQHLGYEADLLDAVEAMESLGLTFDRQAISDWHQIWLKPAEDELEMVGGGITILDSRTFNANSSQVLPVVSFTDSHIKFQQSLLVRAVDLPRLPTHDALLPSDVVGVMQDTTGELRLLQLLGITDDEGTELPETILDTTNPTLPQVLYLEDESALLSALSDGSIDAVARGTAGNSQAARESNGLFAVTALDIEIEYGGFTVDIDDTDLLERMNTAIAWLTDNGSIGILQWTANSNVFNERAELWNLHNLR